VHEVRAIAGEGLVRDRFTEGEPMALEVWIYAEEPVDGARVTVGFRDGNGRPVGSQTLTDVRLRAQRLERLRLHFPGLPMREGRYYVDVGVGTGDGRSELALAERALELTVFGQDSGASGPVRLGGTWELPPVDGAGEGWAEIVIDPLLVRACRREPVERTPVWFMRQAGRSLPEYRELRKRYGLFEVCRQPELCAEVTLQPVHAHGVDAAVMFADIMLPVLGMGVEVELVENVGPVVAEPVRTLADVGRLQVPEP